MCQFVIYFMPGNYVSLTYDIINVHHKLSVELAVMFNRITHNNVPKIGERERVVSEMPHCTCMEKMSLPVG